MSLAAKIVCVALFNLLKGSLCQFPLLTKSCIQESSPSLIYPFSLPQVRLIRHVEEEDLKGWRERIGEEREEDHN